MQTVGALILTHIPPSFPACHLALLTVPPPMGSEIQSQPGAEFTWIGLLHEAVHSGC